MAYSDVCVSQSGKVCVSDRLNGKINIFKRDDVIFKLIDTVGVQSDKMIEGDSTKATLEEPFGVEFLGEAIYICCHRTGLKLHSDTRFALQYCQEVEKLYIADGFKIQETEETEVVEETPEELSFADKLKKVEETAAFMESINSARIAQTGKTYISSEHGGIFPHTLKCLQDTCTSLNTVKENLQQRGCALEDLNFYPFSNESPVERGFGKGVQQSQYSVFSQQQYAWQKVTSSDDLIRKCSETKFTIPTRVRSQYHCISMSPLIKFLLQGKESLPIRRRRLKRKQNN